MSETISLFPVDYLVYTSDRLSCTLENHRSTEIELFQVAHQETSRGEKQHYRLTLGPHTKTRAFFYPPFCSLKYEDWDGESRSITLKYGEVHRFEEAPIIKGSEY